MYSHVACDVMKERTLYLLKPSSLIWHLMPYLFLYMLTGTRLIDLCEYAVLLIISFSSCLDVVIAYAISLLKTKTQTSLRLRGFVIRLLESINMLFAYCKGGNSSA